MTVNKGACQIEDCPLRWRFKLFRTLDTGEKIWTKVCAVHEKITGDENLRRVDAKKD